MAKSIKSQPAKQPAERLEELLRKTIDDWAETAKLSEQEHFAASEEALSLILEGVEMRLAELEDEGEEEDLLDEYEDEDEDEDEDEEE